MNFVLAEMDAVPALFAGGIGLVIVIFLVVLWLAWLLLPFLILSSLKKLREEVIKADARAHAIAQENIRATKALSSALVAVAELQQATNQHLQSLFGAHVRTNQMLDWGADLAAKKTAQP